MTINSMVRNFKRLLDTNAPVILTGIAVSGACLTTYFAAKGGMKSAPALEEALRDKELLTNKLPADKIELSNSEKLLATYKFYAPAAVSLVGTSVCMVMATKIGLERTAAVAGAFVIAERANDQYRDKVKELLGENKHIKVEDAVANDDADKVIVPSSIVLEGSNEQVFIDRWSGRAFPSTMEKMNKAVNDFNHEMLYGSYASLSEFYKLIGLSDTDESDDIGWNKERLLELVYTPLLKDEKAVVAFSYDRKPMPDFQDGDI